MVTLATKTKVLAAFRDMKNRGSMTEDEEKELRGKVSEIGVCKNLKKKPA